MSSSPARKLDPARTAGIVSRPAPVASPRPARAPTRAPAAKHETAAAPARHLLLATIMMILVAINAIGTSYYASPIAVRVRHPMHDWLRPSGIIGQGAGLLAFIIFVFLWLYPLRKRVKALAWTGSVGRWLDVHVAAALALPLLLAIHAAWRFDGLIGLGYTAILLVCASGVIGRYLYTRIPRARSGVELTRDEVVAQRTALLDRIAATTGLDRQVVDSTLHSVALPTGHAGIGRSMLDLVAGDLVRWNRVRALRRRWTTLAPPGRRPSKHSLDEAVRLASREIALEQQVRLLDATHRVFRWWHVAHRPVAMTALVAVLVHVIVVIAVGATWLG
jgi:hypothetical protein